MHQQNIIGTATAQHVPALHQVEALKCSAWASLQPWLGSSSLPVYLLNTNILMQVALHYKLCKPRQLHMNLSEVLRAHLELPHAILPGQINYQKAAGELRAFMTVTELQPGTPLFQQVPLCC